MNAQTICNVCIMDDSDPDIQFFGADGCNHCIGAKKRLATETFPGPEGEKRLADIVAMIKKAGEGKPYDCLIGISGGVDSSYVALKAKELGLRPLAMHVDNGWNSELAVHNIQSMMEKVGIDLVTHVIDWEEVRALQRACFNAPVLDVEIVGDHAIFSSQFIYAAKHGIRYILSGSNVATESIMPKAWYYDKRDGKNLLGIYKKCGTEKVRLRTYPKLMPLRFLYSIFVKKIRFIPMLNYGAFNKAETVEFLKTEFGWKPYPNKHGESTFTRFFQDYYLPTKFNIDKRRAHYSSQIASGQMEREEALALMNKPLFRPDELVTERDYVLKKLGYSEAQWNEVMSKPAIPHTDFANNGWMFDHNKKLTQFIRRFAKFEAKKAA